ncbi:MAG: hypothetical protein ACKO96_46215 [Flammeovirgaceae bacterium]
MVAHDDKRVNMDALVADQEGQTIHDDVFEPVFMQQVLPLKAGDREELRMFFGINHSWQGNEMQAHLLATFISLVGEEHQRGRRLQSNMMQG